VVAFGTAVALFAGGCGDEEPEEAAAPKKAAAEKKEAAPGTVLKLTVVPKPGEITFDKQKLEAPAGRIGIELTNPTELNHNVRIQTGKKCCFAPGHEDLGGTDTGVGKITGTVDLKPGKYFYLCAVGGHWQLGQWGTLTVR
jgi:plastocyanin